MQGERTSVVVTHMHSHSIRRSFNQRTEIGTLFEKPRICNNKGNRRRTTSGKALTRVGIQRNQGLERNKTSNDRVEQIAHCAVVARPHNDDLNMEIRTLTTLLSPGWAQSRLDDGQRASSGEYKDTSTVEELPPRRSSSLVRASPLAAGCRQVAGDSRRRSNSSLVPLRLAL